MSLSGLHGPQSARGDGILLTHGAGSNADAPLLVKLSRAFESQGVHVWRYDLPFRQKRASGPPSPGSAAQDRAGLKDAVVELKARGVERVFLGGHSYGGRQSSMLAAEEPALVSGLLLLSYPLHPPHKPEELRTAHFPQLRTASLFLHGSRDPFGTPDELREAVRTIPARAHVSIVEGAGHDLRKGASGLPEAVWAAFQEFFELR